MDGDHDPSRIGIMHPAFSVGKKTLISWLNDEFETNYEKVEDCADGAIYVQLCDSIFTLKDNQMKKVKWGSKSKNDWQVNWRIVQNCFKKQGIPKELNVSKVMNGKFQDNLEVMQWFKHFHDCKSSGDYEAVKRRNLSPTVPKKSKKGKQRSVTRKKNETSSPTERKSKKTGKQRSVTRKKPKETGDTENKLQELREALEKATNTIDDVEKERNFYFGKLREIEILCQGEFPEKDMKEFESKVLEVMYKTDEDSGLISPQSNEENNEKLGSNVDEDPNMTF